MLALLWEEWLSVYSCVGSDHGLHLRVLKAEAKQEWASSRRQFPEEEDVCAAICSWKQGKVCRAELLIGLLCLFSGHPGLWDVLPGRGVAAGEEADRHRWDCLLRLPQRERHLPVPGREWDLPCERWRPPWIHREFTHLLSLCRTLLWQGSPLAWSESKEQIISSYCTGTGSDLDNPGNRVIHRVVFP